MQEKEAKAKAAKEEAEREAMLSVDWHDFVVVETIEFFDDELEELPGPMTVKDVSRGPGRRRREGPGAGERGGGGPGQVRACLPSFPVVMLRSWRAGVGVGLNWLQQPGVSVEMFTAALIMVFKGG